MIEVSKRGAAKHKNGKTHADGLGQNRFLPLPDSRRSQPVRLSDNARTVLEKRYIRRGADGKPVETIEEMFWRVAYHVALGDGEADVDPVPVAERYYDLLTSLRFFPNSPTFTGAGTPLGQLAACFVLPIADDMGRHPAGIFQTLRDAALIQQTGGGNGFGFGRLRPKGTLVQSSAGEATGPVGFLRVYDKAFGEIAQGGSRRGANMAVMPVYHPDVEEFVTSKTDENHITNFNISVGITDDFMRAVKDDDEWQLVFPDVHSPQYKGFDGTLAQARAAGIPIKGHKRMRARDLFRLIVRQAHHNGEPGVLFLDAANRENPVPHLYELEATNPCVTGETLVATPSGWRRADRIREGDEICTVLGVGRVATIEVNRDVPVFDVHLSDGAVVRATASHQFHARKSRTKFFDPCSLSQLALGDWVRIHRSTVPENPLPPTSAALSDGEYGFLVGVLVGDGCYTPHALSKNVVRISTHADEQDWNALLQRAFAKVGAEKMYCYVNEGSRSMIMDPKPGRVIAEWVKSLPLEPARGPEKRLPEVYVNSNREFLVGLLDGLLSTDGSVDLSSNHPLLRFHTSSLELARQVRRILIMFGVHGRIATSIRKGHALGGRILRHDRPKYDVLISGSSLGRFFEQIRLSHPGKQARLEEAALRSNFTGGNWAAKVVKIEPAGTAMVYDLYEPKSDTWITEGVVSRGCGEQWLGSYENCCLGSINLAQHFGPRDETGRGTVDWEKLRESAELSTRFLDDVVSANRYVPAVPQLRQAALRARRIGLGIMGLGDLMYHAGVRYGSAEAQEFAAQVFEFVRYHAMLASVELAKDHGPFEAIEGSIYDPANLTWSPPKPIAPHTRDFGRPAIDWGAVVEGIRRHGIRNACQTTVAPTGTIATVAGCESYGCEPVFALAYIRHVNDRGRDLQLTYTSPLFERALIDAGLDEAIRNRIVERVLLAGSCQDIPEVPDAIRHTFVVSQDTSAEEHVRMQAALQAFVDNSLSKCVTGETLVLTGQGLMPIAELSEMRLPDQFEPLALDVVTPNGVERTDAFYYGGMRETRRLRLSYGYQVEGTPNHRVHALGLDGAVRFARLDEVRVGDTVVLYSGQEVFGTAGKPLPPYRGETRTSAKSIRFPERMSAELAYLLGCITSEGAISRNGISITNGDRALLERLGGLFDALFGLAHHICRDDRRESVYALQVNSRALRNWLLVELGLEAGARNKIIPTCILSAGRREIAAFLRGLFLDGYMTRDGRLFGIGLASPALLRQLQTLLLNFGVVSAIHKTGDHAWTLTVSGGALERLAAFVEFDEVWKNERLALRHEGRVHRLSNYIDLLPEAVTEALRREQAGSRNSLRSLYGEQSPAYQRARVNLLQGHRLDRETALEIDRHFNDAPDPFAEAFFEGDREGMLYVTVKSIEAGFAEVFDVSVPGSHTFVANGLGNHNTCNFPEGATEDDVARAYMLAWELGCKGLTVYVTGSREKVVLETHATAKAKEKDTEKERLRVDAGPAAAAPQTPTLWHEAKKPRPTKLSGSTFQMNTPLGKSFVTINENGGRQPFEVFITTAKAGSETAAVSEALGRLISYILRLVSPVSPRDRMAEVVRQLGGIGGGRPMGFGPNRVLSLPDGVARALAEYLGEGTESPEVPAPAQPDTPAPNAPAVNPAQMAMKIGDLCPDCGEAALVNEEGCRKCYSCGFSMC